jgi:hypothetical protein
MKRLYLFILFLLVVSFAVIYASSSEAYVTYYISTTDGNDSNDGISLKRPFRTLKALPRKHHVRVCLKRGDIFFEQISNMHDCIFDAYGKGQEPVLCGFKILKNLDAWKYDERGYWTIDLSNENDFIGYLNHNSSATFNNVGMIYDAQLDKVYGHRVKSIDQLKNDGDFFLYSYYTKDSISLNPFKTLYWKSSVNPKKMGNICFSTGVHGVVNNENIIIQNIAIVGFGGHGVHISKPNHKIQNCRIDLIGGSVQVGYSYWVRYGNGVEVWGNSSNDTIKNCLISRTYDCGSTIQGNGRKELKAINVLIAQNRFYHCRQAFEHFFNPTNGGNAEYVNSSFTNNICYLMGENEFGSPEKRDANIQSLEKVDRNLKIQNNIFFGAPLYNTRCFGSGLSNNTVYIFKGQSLCSFHAAFSYTPIYANSQADIETYQRQVGDDSRITILDPNSTKALKVGRKIKKRISWKCLDLKINSLVNLK